MMKDRAYISYDHRLQLRGELLSNESLSRYTSFKVGGLADYLYKPVDIEDLAYFLFLLPEKEYVTWLGAGTNVLVRDSGIRGTVIFTHRGLDQLQIFDSLDSDSKRNIKKKIDQNIHIVRAEVGVPSPMLAHFCLRLSLTGLEFLSGIPGSVGGALTMNAGAFDQRTWDHVIAVETLNRFGRHRLRNSEEFQVNYRDVEGPGDEWFVAGYFGLKKGDQAKSRRYIQDMLEKRKRSHPLNLPNAGSIFRNPEGDYAARLIESAGLKGYRIGGASVSQKHANFIVNDQQATATDIEQLMEYMMEIVKEKHGVRLDREVRIMGDM